MNNESAFLRSIRSEVDRMEMDLEKVNNEVDRMATVSKSDFSRIVPIFDPTNIAHINENWVKHVGPAAVGLKVVDGEEVVYEIPPLTPDNAYHNKRSGHVIYRSENGNVNAGIENSNKLVMLANGRPVFEVSVLKCGIEWYQEINKVCKDYGIGSYDNLLVAMNETLDSIDNYQIDGVKVTRELIRTSVGENFKKLSETPAVTQVPEQVAGDIFDFDNGDDL